MLRPFAISLLALLALAAPSFAQVEMQLDLIPETAEIGEPVSVVLTAEHIPGISIEAPKDVLPDDSWILLEDAQQLTVPHPDRDGLVLTVVRWSVASLEPGAREFAFPSVRWSEGSSAGLVELSSSSVQVGAALEEGEDALRPARVFREPNLPEARVRNWPWAVGGVVVLVLLVYLVRRKKPTKLAQSQQVSPLEQLDTLESRSGELGIRATYFELSQLVRGALEVGGQSGAGLTDEEWLARRAEDPRSTPQEHEALSELLARCQAVKYAQAEPTRWALDETIATAKSLAAGARREAPEVAA